MRVLAILLPILLLTGCGQMSLSSRSGGPAWITDYALAAEKARSEKRMILINFTGSDWCGWCKRLQAEVFSKPAFWEYAQGNLILLEIDFPRNKTQLPQQAQANQELAERFRVQGFPTLYLLDPEGRTLGSTGYLPGGAEAFVSELKRMAGNRVQVADSSSDEGGAGLRLTGISGAPGNRLAIVNNITLAVGESAFVRTSEGRVQVRCIAILEDAVILAVDGRAEPMELHLSGRL